MGTSKREGIRDMPFYLLQASYTPDAWRRMKTDKIFRMCAKTIQPSVERHGGKFLNAWLSFGEYDSVCITEMPDNKSATAVSMELSAGGMFKAVKTTPLIPLDEGREALDSIR
jgi:uncharacterized protein with GYD domain